MKRGQVSHARTHAHAHARTTSTAQPPQTSAQPRRATLSTPCCHHQPNAQCLDLHAVDLTNHMLGTWVSMLPTTSPVLNPKKLFYAVQGPETKDHQSRKLNAADRFTHVRKDSWQVQGVCRPRLAN
eukprot:155340-Chlamydomonas_euryale.AAC.2